MFVVTDEKIELDLVDIAELAGYLRLPSAQRVLKAWVARRPAFVKKGTAEEMLVASGEVAGYEAAISELLSFIAPVPKEQGQQDTTNYPDLDAEQHWENATPKVSDEAPRE